MGTALAIAIAILVLLHLSLCVFFMVDLMTVSQRRNKLQWGVILTFLPLVSAVLYQRSKKRDKGHNG